MLVRLNKAVLLISRYKDWLWRVDWTGLGLTVAHWHIQEIEQGLNYAGLCYLTALHLLLCMIAKDGGRLSSTRLQYPTAGVGTTAGPGRTRLQHPVIRAKMESRPCQAGSEQLQACARPMAGNGPGQGAKGMLWLGCECKSQEWGQTWLNMAITSLGMCGLVLGMYQIGPGSSTCWCL